VSLKLSEHYNAMPAKAMCGRGEGELPKKGTLLLLPAGGSQVAGFERNVERKVKCSPP